jgi:dolichyl-phosphate-mannose-protein mannosyltransferase
MTASVMGMVKVTKSTENNESFTKKWWLWLIFTGTMISCTISVKFVGLFVVLLVGFHTINDLWNTLADLTKPVVSALFLKALHFLQMKPFFRCIQ